MNQKLNTKEIGQLLDHAAARLDQETLDKLMAARRTALSHQQTAQQAPVLAWLSGHGLIHHGSSHSHKAFNWGVAALVAAVLFGGALYLQQSYEHDHSDIDIAILTDELPVDMYVD
jgi:hypothetical protein